MADNNEVDPQEPIPPDTGVPLPEASPPPADTEQPLTEKQATATPNTETPPADMEIHHASHVHHKKKWKDYLFEFFMLFLAVSSGFLVENQREHYVEHLRAKEYAAMLRKDLVSDTLIINIIIEFRNQQAKRYDSLKNIINNVPIEKIDQRQFLGLVSEAGKYLHLLPNNGTLQQLKSSGSLRYFTDTALIYTLTSYEEDLKHGEYVQAEEREHAMNRIFPFKMEHFNYQALDAIPAVAQNMPAGAMVDIDKKTMLAFYNMLDKSASFNDMLGPKFLVRYKEKATTIIEMLMKEYHLE